MSNKSKPHPRADIASGHPLVGKAFLSYKPDSEDGKPSVEWQGEILAVVPSNNPVVGDLALIQLQEWMVGADNDCLLLPITAFTTEPGEGRSFKLFHTVEARNDYYETWRHRDTRLGRAS
jgi:hypothetical protein